ncbi:hypothetical protein BD410DRAFT_742237 [Rickenella mellea]|uniref:Uncharacterized protein n=1 Tax=Rickenella mellea TaxID=50990 RepID=A0A4Y7QDZ0_9AGAM|nr:hypothetical protein BD410DRAFT_742237 [Rickenella mellea]
MSSLVHIREDTKYFPATQDGIPALALQVTYLVDLYMFWVGVTEESAENVTKAISEGNLTKDWACAMPPNSASSSVPASATSLFRSSGSDIALSMAQRLARRFGKQIFLCVDLPPSYATMGQSGMIVMELEKRVVEVLKLDCS